VSSFGGRGYGRPRRWQKLGHVPAVSGYEADQVDRDYTFPEHGFCHECEANVDEPGGKLHRATCKVEPARKVSA
jgi:hypothetical protein